MLTILAYAIVIALTNVVCFFGEMAASIPVAFALVWTSQSWRVVFAGIIGGTAGVVLSVVFGYYVFSWLVGPEYYGLGPFLASTLPLLITIWGKMKHFREVQNSRIQLLDTISKNQDDEVVERMADATASPILPNILGALMGLGWAVKWYMDNF